MRSLLFACLLGSCILFMHIKTFQFSGTGDSVPREPLAYGTGSKLPVNPLPTALSVA